VKNLTNDSLRRKVSLPRRISARLKVRLKWKDNINGEDLSVCGVTENVGEMNTLVSLEVLPKVGSDVNLKLFYEDRAIIETLARVIRVERYPGKPLAALAIVENIELWQRRALEAADSWLTRNLKLNYGEEGAN